MRHRAIADLRTDKKLEALLHEPKNIEGMRESIRRDGIHVPLLITPDGLVLDGHRRLSIAKEIGLEKVPVHELPVNGRRGWRGAVAKLVNLHRRHLGDLERAMLGTTLLRIEREAAAKRQKDAGKEGGKEGGRGKKKPFPSKEGKGFPHAREAAARVAEQLGMKRATFERAIHVAEQAPEEIRAKAFAGELTVSQAANLIREQKNKEALAAHPKISAPGIHHGDFQELSPKLLEGGCSHLVLTDPPYGEVELYEAAAREAFRVLRPGGSFLAYSGQKHLEQVLAACSKHLKFWWLLSLEHSGRPQIMNKLGIRCEWKPIVWFVKNTRGDVTTVIRDRVAGSGREKDQHEWQQGETEAAELIGRLTSENDLVVDFMAGSGTVLAAAKKLSRRYVGFESRADHVETIIKRLGG